MAPEIIPLESGCLRYDERPDRHLPSSSPRGRPPPHGAGHATAPAGLRRAVSPLHALPLGDPGAPCGAVSKAAQPNHRLPAGACSTGCGQPLGRSPRTRGRIDVVRGPRRRPALAVVLPGRSGGARSRRAVRRPFAPLLLPQRRRRRRRDRTRRSSPAPLRPRAGVVAPRHPSIAWLPGPEALLWACVRASRPTVRTAVPRPRTDTVTGRPGSRP